MKKITIGGKTYKITFNPKERGGWFGTTKQEIRIGTKDINNQLIGEQILHEIIECILAERMLRYQLPYVEHENGYYLFSFNHHQFEELIKDVHQALQELGIKLWKRR